MFSCSFLSSSIALTRSTKWDANALASIIGNCDNSTTRLARYKVRALNITSASLLLSAVFSLQNCSETASYLAARSSAFVCSSSSVISGLLINQRFGGGGREHEHVVSGPPPLCLERTAKDHIVRKLLNLFDHEVR